MMSFKTNCLTMVLFFSVWISTSLGKPVIDRPVDAKDEMKAMNYLMQYNYLKVPDGRAGHLRTQKEVTDSIKTFQMYAGIPVTGQVDHQTMEMMEKPRCGMSDFSRSDGARRRKRYELAGMPWMKKSLTYMYQGGPRRSITMDQVKELMNKAFKVWESHTNLTITETNDQNADILIRFREGNHGDGYPFDGEGGRLGHGFFPFGDEPGIYGDIHFDDDENWGLPGTNATDFYWTALHEIGHALGLHHSSYKNAVMYSIYTGYKKDRTLSNDDIEGIQYLYGMPEIDIETAPPPTKGVTDLTLPSKHLDVNPCRTSFDAVFTDDKSGITNFFAGKYYWTVNATGQRNGPYLVNKRWSELPDGGIDAAFQSKGKTVFFKGQHCWVYNGTQLLKEKEEISKVFGVDPAIESIDAAFAWGSNGKTYLFKGDLYWRYNEAINSLDMGYPRRINESWNGIPSNIDSAMTWVNGKTYFFKGSGFWLIDNMRFTVTDFKPMKTSMYWMKCAPEDLDLADESAAGLPQKSSSVILVLSGLTALLSLYVNNE